MDPIALETINYFFTGGPAAARRRLRSARMIQRFARGQIVRQAWGWRIREIIRRIQQALGRGFVNENTPWRRFFLRLGLGD